MEDNNRKTEILEETLIGEEVEVHNNTEEKEDVFFSEKNLITEDNLFKFIGAKNLDYYAKVFRRNKEKDNFVSWNWAAFLFAPFWLAYRKMYGWLAIFLVADTIAEGIGTMSVVVGILLKIAIIVIVGIFGNCIYLSHCKKKINSINSELEDYENKDEVTKANGGTSGLSVVIFFLAIIIFVALMIFVMSLLSSAMSIGLYSFL